MTYDPRSTALPAQPSLDSLRQQAKSLLKSAKAKEDGALSRIGPHYGDPAAITLQQAQLVIARDYGFSSWARLKKHIETAPPGDKTTEQLANRFLDLACLHYGPDNSRGPADFQTAADLLSRHPEISGHSIHTAVVSGDIEQLENILTANPAAVDDQGGPFHWSPLMYAAYSRLPGVSTYHAACLLLAAGADPNAHYYWGGTYRFAVLTGIFGDGERGKVRLPEHPDMVPFARAVLDAGANPNDSQGAYNRCFSADNTHLELMLEYGLKDSDPSDWWLTEENRQANEHRTMHFQLILALQWGFAERARLLIEHGVDINTPDNNYYDTYTRSFKPYQIALLRGLPDIAELIKLKGGDAEPLSGAARFQAACMSGNLREARSLFVSEDHSPDIHHEMLCEAAGNGNLAAVNTMIELGFDLNPRDRATPLHAAAWRGQVAVIKALLEAGADARQRDPEHYAPPLGHALYAGRQEVIDLLMNAPMDIFMAAAIGNIEQINARLEEDAAWLNAPFSAVRPCLKKAWPNDWAPPLWYAAVNGQSASVEHLLTLGADPTRAGADGRTLADHADAAGQAAIAARLKA